MNLRFGVGLGVALVVAGGALSSCIFVYSEADSGTGGAGGLGGNPTATSVTTGGAGGGSASGAGGVGGVGGAGGTGGGDCEDTVGPYTTELPSPVTELAVSLDGAAAFIGPVYSNAPGCGDPGMMQLAFYEKGAAMFDDAEPTWCAPIPPDGIPAKQRHIAISDQRVAVAFNVSMGKAKLMLFNRLNPDMPVVRELEVPNGSIALRSVAAADDLFFVGGTLSSTNAAGRAVTVKVSSVADCDQGELVAMPVLGVRSFVFRIQEDGTGCTMATASLPLSDFESLAVNDNDVLLRRLRPSAAGGSDLIRLDRTFSVGSGNTILKGDITAEPNTEDFRRLAGGGNFWRTTVGTNLRGANRQCCTNSCCTTGTGVCCPVVGDFWSTAETSIYMGSVNGIRVEPTIGNTFVFGSANLMTGDLGYPRVLAVWDGGNSTKVWGASESEWPATRGGTVLGARPIAEGAELFIYAAGSKACKDRWVLERTLFTFVP